MPAPNDKKIIKPAPFILDSAFNKDGTFQRTWQPWADYFEMAVLESGYEKCSPSHSWGEGKKPFHVIHYILSGSGILIVNGRGYRLGKGDGFYISPLDMVYYMADETLPWEYYWVSFAGSKATEIMTNISFADTNVFHWEEDDFFQRQLSQIFQYSFSELATNYFMLGQLYIFFGGLIVRFPAKKHEAISNDKGYVDAAIDYIKNNYSGVCTVLQISKKIGVSRTYLYKLFIKYYGLSPTDYIERFRITRACELFKTQQLLIMEVASAVGYVDQFYFSRVFKKVIGMSPKDYIQSASPKSLPEENETDG